MDFSQDSQHLLDRQLGLALGIVVAYKALTENNRDRSRNLGALSAASLNLVVLAAASNYNLS